MKAFRGTLIAAAILAAIAVITLLARPELLDPDRYTEPVGHPRLFEFEKHELVKVEVKRPDGDTVTLQEIDGKWTIGGTEFVAGRSMVNRVKHQIHDLTARATVVEQTDQPELYGLGRNAISVALTLRDGRSLEFLAGDPNPSSVSYYLQPVSGDELTPGERGAIYTVKKSAVDYYSLTLDEFRERRFAGFDSKDVTRIQAGLSLEGEGMESAPDQLDVESVGERLWQMRAPVEMAANDDRVRRLMGRVSALKARDFLPVEDDLEPFGLAAPRADITVSFASRDPLRLLVGADAPSDNRFEELAYMMLAGDDTIYIARRGLLEEFGQDPAELRNRRVVRMKAADVVAVDAWLEPTEDDDLTGNHGVRFAAEQWVWKDGVPVPGSTPKRVAQTLAELEVHEFIADDVTDLAPYGLDAPVARVVLTDRESAEREVWIGDTGEPLVDPEGHERERYYATVAGSESVYLVEYRVLNVIKDMIREGERKRKKDEEKAARRERIDSIADPEEEESP